MLVKINGQQFPAELMKTPEEISKGMMERDSLNGCMVFKLKKGFHSFWMKNCKISLDIIFVLNNKITKIHRNCQPCTDCTVRYNGTADHVIEFPTGTTNTWNEGDNVNLYLGTQLNPVN
jgi:uncharacterized membrane protein (UPF0127 family)